MSTNDPSMAQVTELAACWMAGQRWNTVDGDSSCGEPISPASATYALPEAGARTSTRRCRARWICCTAKAGEWASTSDSTCPENESGPCNLRCMGPGHQAVSVDQATVNPSRVIGN